MQNQLTTKSGTIVYSVKVSRRAKRPRISVSASRGVTVTLPQGFSLFSAESLLREKLDWVVRALNYFKRLAERPFIQIGRRDYALNRERALVLAKDKVKYWNGFYNFSYARVSVKNQKTRWGSCSQKGNLNFNYKIVHLPEHLLDYLVVHELCHLKELNHSKNFWNLVGQTIPNYKQCRRELTSLVIRHGQF